MANLLIPWQRYLSDVAHKYVGYPDEEGGEEVMIVHVNSETNALDKTFNEMKEATENGPVIIYSNNEQYGITNAIYCIAFYNREEAYHVVGLGVTELTDESGTQYNLVAMVFIAEAENSYPVLVDD